VREIFDLNVCEASALAGAIVEYQEGVVSQPQAALPAPPPKSMMESSATVPATVSNFEYSVDSKEAFPYHGGGAVIFKREWFIKKSVDMVLRKRGEKYESHYWRAPFGSGKTVFLKLMGRELQQRGCDVYRIIASKMDNYAEDYFIRLAKDAGNKTVALLIDEVQNNMASGHWDSLLKESKPPNLLVLGVGIPQLLYASPQFDNKYPENDASLKMFLTHEDLPEVCAYFARMSTVHSKEIIMKMCERLLEFTAGHIFPFVTIANHLCNPDNKIDLVNINSYLSSKEFYDSDAHTQLQKRCFSYLSGESLTKAGNLLMNKGGSGDRADLEKLGVWERHGFISPLVTAEVFEKMDIPSNPDLIITLDDTQKTPYAEQIICAGLRDMNEEDFKDGNYNITAVENAIGFRWGYNIRSVLPEVWFAPQVRTQYAEHNMSGAKPVIDFFFNGRLNLGIELALNLKADGITKHLQRFDYDYKRFKKNGVLLHFITEKDTPVVDLNKPYDSLHYKNSIYTFVKKKNALYRGSTLIQSNVARRLPFPPARYYSNTSMDCVRKFVRML